jgi:hypothetical protein
MNYAMASTRAATMCRYSVVTVLLIATIAASGETEKCPAIRS